MPVQSKSILVPEPGGAQRETTNLIVPNVYEFNRRNARQVVQAPGRAALFSQISFLLRGLVSKHTFALAYFSPSPSLLAHWHDALEYSPSIIAVRLDSGRISLDAKNDPAALDQLRAIASRESLGLWCWGATAQLRQLSLSASLRLARGHESVLESLDLIDLLDGKAANRALVDMVVSKGQREFATCPYHICSDSLPQLRKSLTGMLAVWPRIIVKPGLTWGGKATRVVGRNGLTKEFFAAICGSESREFSGGYVLVEPFLGGRRNVSPSTDWNPWTNGGIGQAYVGQMLMDGCKCVGTIYGKDCLGSNENLRTEMRTFAGDVANSLKEIGYVGWFDVDFLIAGSKRYINEINIRHTGGTVSTLVAEQLLGAHWEIEWSIAESDGIQTSFDDVGKMVDRIRQFGYHFSNDVTKFVVLAHDEVESGQFRASYWIAARSREGAANAMLEVRRILA